jgi:hypothetical protein
MKIYNWKLVAISVALSVYFYESYGQTPLRQDYFWDNVRFGGNIGGSFGNRFTSVVVAPQAIYQFSPKIGLGAGLSYNYINSNFNDGFTADFKSTLLGASIIGIANPVEFLQLSADFEYLHVNRDFEDSMFRDDRYWVPALFIGAGYRQDNFVIGARYDVLYSESRSVFQRGLQPFVRVLF